MGTERDVKGQRFSILGFGWWMLFLSIYSPGVYAQSGEVLEPEEIEAPQVEAPQVEAPGDDFSGKLIVGYELRCDLELCASDEAVESFKELSGLAVGQLFEPRRVERAQERLAKTGFFRQLAVERRLEDGGVVIEIEALGAVLIRRVRFEGLKPPPFEEELRKVLMYRSGQVFFDDEDRVTAQLSSLEALFEREGYFGSEIQMEVEPVSGESHLVDLIFRVERGEDRRICAIGFRGVRAMTTAQARELLFSEVSFLARRVPIFLPMFTTAQFRAGRDALIKEYRELGYFRARIVDQAVQIDEQTNCVQLLVDVNEGPLWEVEIEGNQNITFEELRAELPFAESGYVDDEEIKRAENMLRQSYEARGFPFAQVRGREVIQDRLDRRLIFTINEGPQLQITRVAFSGVTAFTEEEARRGFGTQAFGLFDSGGYLQTEQLLSDFLRLEERYREAGYMQAQVTGFAVELNDAGDGITIRVNVNEGAQTVVERVDVTGYQMVAPGRIQQLLEVKAGEPFVPLRVQADQSRLIQRYGTIGYPRVKVTTGCRRLGGEPVSCQAPRLPPGCRRTSFEDYSGGACQWYESATPTLVCQRLHQDESCVFEEGVVDDHVVVHHHVEEGPRVRVGEILLKGNFRTRSPIIFRELPLETGELLDVQRLIEGQGNMRSLGLFDSVSIETIGLDDEEPDGEDQVASLIISVEESRSRFLDFRFGVEGRDLLTDGRRLLLTGEAQYTNNNLRGSGQRFRPRLIGALDTLELPGLWAGRSRGGGAPNLDVLFGAELIYNHPRFLKSQTGISKLHLTITPFYLLDQLGVSTTQATTALVLREEWGLRMELRKELFEWLERFYITFGVEAKQAATWTPEDLVVDGERIFSPRRATAKFVPELTWDRRDSPLNPRRGFYLQFKPELVSGDALAQGGEDLIGDSYWRLSLSASYFFSFWEDFTFGQGLYAGQISPLFDRQTLVPPDERFYLGGVGSVRGFATNTLGPTGSRQQPTGGEFLLNYSAELRYPLMRQWSLYGATFFDAGLLVDCFDDGGDRHTGQCYANAFPRGDWASQIRVSAGLGIRFLIVDQIPLLFDYGVVLNRRPGEELGSFHFNLGYTF